MPRDDSRVLRLLESLAIDGMSHQILSRTTCSPCMKCGVGWLDWEAPLHIRWELSDAVGDFTFLRPGSDSVLISTRVRQALEREFPVVATALLPVIEHNTDRILFRADPGPLWWFRFPRLSVATTGWHRLSPACESCGTDIFLPRKRPVEIGEDELCGWPCFTIEQLPLELYIRSQVRDLILTHQFTNVCMAETIFQLVQRAPASKPRRGRKTKRAQSIGVPPVRKAPDTRLGVGEISPLPVEAAYHRKTEGLQVIEFREGGMRPLFDILNTPTRSWCPNCLSGWVDWEPPLHIRWRDEADHVMDFMSLPSASLIVTDRVRDALARTFPELEFQPVVEENTAAIRFRPDPGPLWWLRVPVIVLDVKQLGWTPRGRRCRECGEPTKGYHEIPSLEEIAAHIGPDYPPLFKAAQISTLIFMREEVRALIKRAGLVNGA